MKYNLNGQLFCFFLLLLEIKKKSLFLQLLIFQLKKISSQIMIFETHKESSNILLLSVCWKTIVNKNEITNFILGFFIFDAIP